MSTPLLWACCGYLLVVGEDELLVLGGRYQRGLVEGEVAVQPDDVRPVVRGHVDDLEDVVGGHLGQVLHEGGVLYVMVEELLHAAHEAPALAEGPGLHQHLGDVGAQVARRGHEHEEVGGLGMVDLRGP